MNIKESILHYLFVYDGEKQGTIKRVEEDFLRGLSIKDQSQMALLISFAFDELVNNSNIELITCEEMNSNQLWRYNTEGKIFYRILNRNID